MEAIQNRADTWIRDQKAKIFKVPWGPLQWRMRWPRPPWSSGDRAQRQKLQQEYEKRKRQLQELCLVVKAESVADLQDILCCMVLSECVYKRPVTEMVRAVNKFRADFGGQLVPLERVQPSSDHVPHRYLLAEAGDTLFASFVGTKQYKDVMADANILQGALFHEDEATGGFEIVKDKGNGGKDKTSRESKPRKINDSAKPAAHRGFMARAKGIPALELYRLAQKKKRKLVLCGHSLGGAVAALATLAILRVIAVSSKENEKVQLKCITFSQPPVGNAALKDYVNKKGWQHHFKTYCIPEDLVPRILSPAYFHHYNAQTSLSSADAGNSSTPISKHDEGNESENSGQLKPNGGEQLVLGVGPVQGPFWRLSKLVPIEAVRKQFNKYRQKQVDSMDTHPSDGEVLEPQSLEIQEGSDGISLKPIADTVGGALDVTSESLTEKAKNPDGNENIRRWNRVPYLPSYVPFGQLYLLGTSSVESLSGPDYSKLTSVRSVFAELRERLQSHSMRSYRSRFQRFYDLCMSDIELPFFGAEQLQQFPHLQQWLGLVVGSSVELGHIVESPVIHAATSVVPLGWNGVPGEKNVEPLKIDITGFRLHLCTLFHAHVDGKWCSTTVDSFPSTPHYSANDEEPPELQKIRVLVGGPLRRPPNHQITVDPLSTMFPSSDLNSVGLAKGDLCNQEKSARPEGLSELFIFCTSDFATVAKEVHLRTRRVRLLGLEGAGKTSLYKAILGQGNVNIFPNLESVHMEADVQEGISGGLCYMDSVGINLQDLTMEVNRFKDGLWRGIRDLSWKTDLIVLVHNLSHRIPRFNNSNASQHYPALLLLLNEAKALGIPWILAITSKFSVSAHQQSNTINSVVQAYQASPSMTAVINSCPYVIPGAASTSLSLVVGPETDGRIGVQKLLSTPIDLVLRAFQRKATIFPVEGVSSLKQLVHRVLQSHEEASLEELARERLSIELAREHENAVGAKSDTRLKSSSSASAAVGASVGAGIGIVLAIVMGAASGLRKP